MHSANNATTMFLCDAVELFTQDSYKQVGRNRKNNFLKDRKENKTETIMKMEMEKRSNYMSWKLNLIISFAQFTMDNLIPIKENQRFSEARMNFHEV